MPEYVTADTSTELIEAWSGLDRELREHGAKLRIVRTADEFAGPAYELRLKVPTSVLRSEIMGALSEHGVSIDHIQDGTWAILA